MSRRTDEWPSSSDWGEIETFHDGAGPAVHLKFVHHDRFPFWQLTALSCHGIHVDVAHLIFARLDSRFGRFGP